MANLSAIFRESAKYLRERERDPRSARLSFEVMLIKLGYIIQQMRKGGGQENTRVYTQWKSSREFDLFLYLFFFSWFCLFSPPFVPHLEWIFFPSFRNFYRASGIETIHDGGILVFLRDVRNLNWRTASNYLFLNANQILHFFIFKNCTSYFHFRASF